MKKTLTFSTGDPVNWDSRGQIVYGFVEEDCPQGTPRLKRIQVEDLNRCRWQVPLENLRATE